MFPSAAPPPHPAAHHHQKCRRLELKSTIHSVKSHISAHQCAWLSATVLLQLLILLFLNRASPPPPPSHPRRQFFTSDDACPYGRLYVYDLPPMLNQDLLDNCQDLEPWSSRCNAVSNAGFGPPATGLDAVVPKNLTPAWSWTDMYAAEVIYHDRAKHYRCRTAAPEKATAFYIPFYAGLAVGKFLWFNYTAKDRDYHAARMLDWVKNQPPWRRSNGSDHFLMIGRLTWDFRRLSDDDGEWGTKFIYMPLMKNVLRLAVERSRWDHLEISVPYPTSFHPRSESDIRVWQNWIRTRPRHHLFAFVGATRKKIRNDFRGILMNYSKSESGSSRVVDCSVEHCYDGAPTILEAFLDSDFCLQPKGDGYTRRSTFDCMLAGSIPVFFWRLSTEFQYEWHLPAAARRYSVFIDNGEVRNRSSIIKEVLERLSKEDVRRMRENIIEFLPRLLYTRSGTDLGSTSDAFDVAMEGVLRRFWKQKAVNGGDRRPPPP
ncbi:xyloglucan galactosyltransferase XLT2-like [Andrographis paniculata]|uniref:xyloglucan galactosyltransferase XLT2-like n=1 Tax=Andrographis paniculata TaxID=175694 RepID=UPI0021E8E90D|nr:xyloglucan galactosyltransferase XLT2-like [Andrographis paniculata]